MQQIEAVASSRRLAGVPDVICPLAFSFVFHSHSGIEKKERDGMGGEESGGLERL